MRFTLLPWLFAGFSSVAFAADPIAGRWKVHTSVSGNESDQTCTLTQKDSDLSGTCTSDRGTVTIIGKVDGNRVKWSYKSTYNGSPLTVNYEGKIDSESKMTGTVVVPEYSAEGEFTATQAK